MALIDNTVSYDDVMICQPNFGGQDLSPVALKSTSGAVNFYPNPANDWLTVEYYFPEAESLALFIYDASGMEVVREKLSVDSGSQLISIGNLGNGIYFCKIFENGKTANIKKLVILR